MDKEECVLYFHLAITVYYIYTLSTPYKSACLKVV